MVAISSISAGINLVKLIYESLDFIRRKVSGSGIISAYFRFDGTRIEGSEKIEIEVHRVAESNAVWWYSVKPVEGYVFVRVPVVESCAHEVVGTVGGDPMPDANYWRWVAPVLPGRIYGGEAANLKVDFLVFGYKPKALIRHFSTK